MDTQFINDTDGNPAFVVLPIEEWEDLLDAADAVKIRAQIDAGQETFPHELVKRLCDENPIRVFREYRGLKQNELASTVGVSPAYISEIEAGKKTGTLDVLKKIAEALNLDLDDIV